MRGCYTWCSGGDPMKGCHRAIRRSGGCYCKGTPGVWVLGAWKRYGSIRARLLDEILATVSGSSYNQYTAMLSLVHSRSYQVSSRNQDRVIRHQLLNRRQSVSHPSGLITSPRPGTRKRVCVWHVERLNKTLHTTLGKAVQHRSGELHGEIPKRRYVVTVLSLWASGLPHEFGDAMLA